MPRLNVRRRSNTSATSTLPSGATRDGGSRAPRVALPGFRRKPRIEPPSVLAPLPDAGLSLEMFRQAFVGLDLPAYGRPVIGITSSIGGEGRTTMAIGLARTLAYDLDGPVMLVDGDLEHPALATRFDLPAGPGLAETLRGDATLADVGHPVEDNLVVVTAGRSGPDASRLLRQMPLLDPFHGASEPTGAVVVDLPPVISQSYSVLAAHSVDVLMLVVRAGVTPEDVVREAIARLEDRAPRGIILNAVRTRIPQRWRVAMPRRRRFRLRSSAA